jgi:glycosyltransferase involved in cell wall biosynthesis
MEISIIIPTHNRAQILRQTLDHIEKQTIRDRLEVIVVSDGPDQKTTEMIQHCSWDFPLHYFAIPKSQQGRARNEGVKKAKGEYVLFIGDDIFLKQNACEIHLNAHSGALQTKDSNLKSYIAVLGHTTWDPAVGITPVMDWLEKTGWQFGYFKIKKYTHGFIPKHIQHRFTYASHVSLPSRIAWKYPFRDDINAYGWEDIEWGLRLQEADIPLYYEPDAKALHHHKIELDQSLKRMHIIGKSIEHVTRASAKMNDRLPRGLKWHAYRAISLLPTMRGRHYRSFLEGMRNMEKK